RSAVAPARGALRPVVAWLQRPRVARAAARAVLRPQRGYLAGRRHWGLQTPLVLFQRGRRHVALAALGAEVFQSPAQRVGAALIRLYRFAASEAVFVEGEALLLEFQLEREHGGTPDQQLLGLADCARSTEVAGMVGNEVAQTARPLAAVV